MDQVIAWLLRPEVGLPGVVIAMLAGAVVRLFALYVEATKNILEISVKSIEAAYTSAEALNANTRSLDGLRDVLRQRQG